MSKTLLNIKSEIEHFEYQFTIVEEMQELVQERPPVGIKEKLQAKLQGKVFEISVYTPTYHEVPCTDERYVIMKDIYEWHKSSNMSLLNLLADFRKNYPDKWSLITND